jgi:catechol 1,2-dioxygenase
MNRDLTSTPEVAKLLDLASGLGNSHGDDRLKRIIRQMLESLFATIDAFDVSDAEFWQAIHFLQSAAPEYGLIVPGLGLERFLDIRADAADAAAGGAQGTPRAIEGPLFVPGAPRSAGEARLDDANEAGEVLIMHGRVTDIEGRPVAGAEVDVWHANGLGGYSHFDPTQSAYNLRRTIITDAGGRYRFRSIMPRGYAVPPDGATDRLLKLIGRHGRRPAHIHFFVSAPGLRHLTTQINIDGDPDLHDDFAYATRDGLVPPVKRHTDAAAIQAAGLEAPYAEIEFDFVLPPVVDEGDDALPCRPRAAALSDR